MEGDVEGAEAGAGPAPIARKRLSFRLAAEESGVGSDLGSDPAPLPEEAEGLPEEGLGFVLSSASLPAGYLPPKSFAPFPQPSASAQEGRGEDQGESVAAEEDQKSPLDFLQDMLGKMP